MGRRHASRAGRCWLRRTVVLAESEGGAIGLLFTGRRPNGVTGSILDLHLGLRTGECEVRDDDLGGLAVHIAARIGSLAEPGEVLVLGTAKDLVVGSRMDFVDRGEHQLKVVPGSWRLYQAVP